MIKGLEPSITEVGKIKIGHSGERYTTVNGKPARRIVKLDHFIITKTEKDENDNFILDKGMMNDVVMAAKVAKEKYTIAKGSKAKDKKPEKVAESEDKITEIPIVLHSDEIEDIFPTRYAYYSGKKVFCSGDGETATRLVVQDQKYTGEKKEVKCPCPFLDSKKCKPNGTLRCSIAIPGRAVAGAVHMWRTTSIISIRRMLGSLQQIHSVCGTLRGIPLWLKLDKVHATPTVTTKGVTKIINTEVYCCHVELRAQDLLDVQKKALELASMRAALGDKDFDCKGFIAPPASDEETEEESAAVQDEYYPENVDDDIIETSTDGFQEGLKKISNKDQDLWGFSEAEYVESSSSTDGAPPAQQTTKTTKREEAKKTKKVA